MNNRKKVIVGCSPITSEIFAGTLLKDGRTWSADKQDVTSTAVGAVAQHLLQRDESVEFTYSDGERYLLKVVRVEQEQINQEVETINQ